nr:hypothetical protein [Oscillatoria laete-virens]
MIKGLFYGREPESRPGSMTYPQGKSEAGRPPLDDRADPHGHECFGTYSTFMARIMMDGLFLVRVPVS